MNTPSWLWIPCLATLALPLGADAQRGGRAGGGAADTVPVATAPPGAEALDFLREPQDRLRVEVDGELLELSNARWTDERIRFDYAWSTAEPGRAREGIGPLALDRVRAIYRRRTDRTKGALIGALSGLGTGILLTALNDDGLSGNPVPEVLAYTGISALIGMLRFKSTKWERAFP